MAKILLVEDDNNLREIYEARLQAEGYEIVSAHDGEEALVVAKNEKPDLIISDVMMPKISGFEMLDILRNTDGLKQVKVIMLTALGQSDDQQRADKLGADRYLVKSQVTLEDIVKVAQDMLSPEAASPDIVASSLSSPTVAQPTTQEVPTIQVAHSSAASTSTTEADATATPVTDDAVKAQDATPGLATPLSTTDATVDLPTPVASEPATPVNTQDATPEPTIASEPTAAPTTASTPVNPVTDDKLMTDAVDSLLADTKPESTTDATATPVTDDATKPPVAPDTTGPASPTSDITLPLASPTPAADLPSPASDGTSLADSTKDEDEKVEIQIEDFAKPTSSEPTPKVIAPEPPAANDPVIITPSAPVESSESSESAASTSSIGKVSAAVTPPTTTDSDTNETKETTATYELTPGFGKKIIEPLDTSTKPNINALLAQEEAKQVMDDSVSAAGAPAKPIIVNVAADDGKSPKPAVDPNSIAL